MFLALRRKFLEQGVCYNSRVHKDERSLLFSVFIGSIDEKGVISILSYVECNECWPGIIKYMTP